MRKIMLVVLASTSLAACATYDGNSGTDRAVRGAAIGAAGGAVLGAVVPGVNAVEGAAAGAAVGAVAGALSKDDDREWNEGYGTYRGSGWSQIDSTVRNDAVVRDWVLRRFDSNNNGSLNNDEGAQAQRALRAIMDTNNNGNISEDEFRRSRDLLLRSLQDPNYRW